MVEKKQDSFHQEVIKIIKNIPEGNVTTYGQIAAMAGSPRAARQVVRILHSSSDKENLPWHRVINSQGRIGLPRERGYEIQRQLLVNEGVEFRLNDSVDLKIYLWTRKL